MMPKIIHIDMQKIDEIICNVLDVLPDNMSNAELSQVFGRILHAKGALDERMGLNDEAKR